MRVGSKAMEIEELQQVFEPVGDGSSSQGRCEVGFEGMREKLLIGSAGFKIWGSRD